MARWTRAILIDAWQLRWDRTRPRLTSRGDARNAARALGVRPCEFTADLNMHFTIKVCCFLWAQFSKASQLLLQFVQPKRRQSLLLQMYGAFRSTTINNTTYCCLYVLPLTVAVMALHKITVAFVVSMGGLTNGTNYYCCCIICVSVCAMVSTTDRYGLQAAEKAMIVPSSHHVECTSTRICQVTRVHMI